MNDLKITTKIESTMMMGYGYTTESQEHSCDQCLRGKGPFKR